MPRDTVETKSPVLQLLEAGRERIGEGWVQNRLVVERLGSYAYCLIGAIRYDRTCRLDMPDSTVTEIFKMLNRAVKCLGGNNAVLSKYNDHPLRTKADVEEVYDIAIEMQWRLDHGLRI